MSNLFSNSPQRGSQRAERSRKVLRIISFILMALVPFSIFAVYKVGGQASASKSWPGVPGKIEYSGVKTVQLGIKEKHTAEVQYSYTVNDRPYTGTRIRFMDTTGSARHLQEKQIAQYPKGSKTTVYYDPANPTQSVLIPGQGAAKWLFYAIPLILAGIAVYMFQLQRSTS